MKTTKPTGLAVAFLLTWAMPARSDEFGRLVGPDFFNLISLPGVRTHAVSTSTGPGVVPTEYAVDDAGKSVTDGLAFCFRR